MVDATAVTYTATGTGAVARTVQDKADEALSILDFGGDPTGTASSTAAFNAAIAAAIADGRRRVYFPQGAYRFATRPDAITDGVILEGDGLNQTLLLRDYSQTGGPSEGFIRFSASSATVGSNGSELRSMAIESNTGTSGGSLISIISTSSYAVSAILLEDLWLTTKGSDTHETVIYVDGTAKTSAPTGSRDHVFRGVRAFGATGYSAVLLGAQGLNWVGGGLYAAGGTGAASGGVQIGGTSAVPSVNVTLNVETMAYLNLSNLTFAHITCGTIGSVAGVSVGNAGSAQYVAFHVGYANGTVLGNWVNSGVYRPTGWSAT
jgi:hypothetical protein